MVLWQWILVIIVIVVLVLAIAAVFWMFVSGFWGKAKKK
jgi:hypothetical protein